MTRESPSHPPKFAAAAPRSVEPPPIYRAAMFFVILSGTGACLTIGKLTSWAPLAWFSLAVLAIAVLAVSWMFRRHVRSGELGELVRNEKG